MKIYWSLNSIPELAEMPKKERKMIWRRCLLKAFRRWQIWIAAAACIGFAGLCGGLSSILQQTWECNAIIGAIGSGVGAGISVLIFFYIACKLVRPYIREYLSSHDEVSRT